MLFRSRPVQARKPDAQIVSVVFWPCVGCGWATTVCGVRRCQREQHVFSGQSDRHVSHFSICLGSACILVATCHWMQVRRKLQRHGTCSRPSRTMISSENPRNPETSEKHAPTHVLFSVAVLLQLGRENSRVLPQSSIGALILHGPGH